MEMNKSHASLSAEIARLREALRRLMTESASGEPGIAHTARGQHCLYCTWISGSYGDTPQHDSNCPVQQALATLDTPEREQEPNDE